MKCVTAEDEGGRRGKEGDAKLDEEQGPMDDDFLAIELAIFSRLPF